MDMVCQHKCKQTRITRTSHWNPSTPLEWSNWHQFSWQGAWSHAPWARLEQHPTSPQYHLMSDVAQIPNRLTWPGLYLESKAAQRSNLHDVAHISGLTWENRTYHVELCELGIGAHRTSKITHNDTWNNPEASNEESQQLERKKTTGLLSYHVVAEEKGQEKGRCFVKKHWHIPCPPCPSRLLASGSPSP